MAVTDALGGSGLVRAAQALGPEFDTLARVLTFLGDEPFYLLALPLVYWCVSRRAGVHLGAVLLTSVWLNGVLKLVFDMPRPYHVDDGVDAVTTAHGGGMPSGHAQNSVAFWGYLAVTVRRPWFRVLAVTLILLTAASRLQLGVHFPADLAVGLAIGAAWLALFLALAPRLERWLADCGDGRRLALAVAFPGALLLGSGGDRISVTAAATLLGLATGLVVERRWLRFTPAGVPLSQRAAAYTLGIAVMALLYLGLKPLGGLLPWEPLARTLRYTLVGLWGAAGAPALCLYLGLLRREESASQH